MSENGGESYARAAMIDLGFVEPTLQVKVMDPLDGMASYRLDYLWTSYDDTERRCEARLTWYGIRILRFSYWEACDDAYFSRLLDGYGVPRAR